MSLWIKTELDIFIRLAILCSAHTKDGGLYEKPNCGNETEFFTMHADFAVKSGFVS